MRGRVKWDNRFMRIAREVATWSKDRSTKVGAVIVSPDGAIQSTGYNGFPRGVDDDVDLRHDRPAKYFFTEHAERNAIYNACLLGHSVKDCTIYVSSLYPCDSCARAIIQAGITTVIVEVLAFHPGFEESQQAAMTMFQEANVKVRQLEKE